jgi:hypothetical protein
MIRFTIIVIITIIIIFVRCRKFINLYLKQATSCSVLQQYGCTCNVQLVDEILFNIITFRSTCVVPSVAVLFSSLISHGAFSVCCSGTVRVILRWFQLLLLLLVSLLFYVPYVLCVL